MILISIGRAIIVADASPAGVMGLDLLYGFRRVFLAIVADGFSHRAIAISRNVLCQIGYAAARRAQDQG